MYDANSPRGLTDQEHADLLGHHLVDDHGRRTDELTGLPLRALHELEHIEESMGLLDLAHSHTV
jgi:hypothetical protein